MNNTAIGFGAALNLTDKSHHNIFIGDRAGEQETDCSYKLIIRGDYYELTKDMTHEEWEALSNIIKGCKVENMYKK